MSVDIDCANTRFWDIVSTGRGIIANHRYNDSGFPSLVYHVLHVASIREVCTAAGIGILIFRLVENNWTTVRNLGFGNGSRDVSNIASTAELASSPQFSGSIPHEKSSHTYQWQPSRLDHLSAEWHSPSVTIQENHHQRLRH